MGDTVVSRIPAANLYDRVVTSKCATRARAYTDDLNTWGDTAEYFLKMGQYGSTLVALNSSGAAHANATSAADAFATGRTYASSLPRVIVPYTKLLTGSIYYQTHDDYTMRYVKVDAHGNKIKIRNPGEWIETEPGSGVYTNGTDRSTDKRYIEASGPGDGVRVRKNLLYIIIDVLILAARSLFTFMWLGDMGTYRVAPKHAKRINAVSMSLWSGVIGLDLYDNIKSAYREKNADKRSQYVWNATGDVLDLAALPFDFGYGMTGNVPVACVGAGLNLASGVCKIAKDIFYYRT